MTSLLVLGAALSVPAITAADGDAGRSVQADTVWNVMPVDSGQEPTSATPVEPTVEPEPTAPIDSSESTEPAVPVAASESPEPTAPVAPAESPEPTVPPKEDVLITPNDTTWD